ncbi:class I adenylate-forming enzyme family protein [Sphingopyxis panaciterrae]
MRIIDQFDQGVAYHGANIAFIDDDTGQETSYAQAGARTHAIAAAIRQHGYQKGTKIAILAPNGTQAFVALLGLMRAEAIWLPVNPRNSIAVNIDLLSRFDGDLLFYDSSYLAEAEQLMQAVTGLRECVCLDRATALGTALDDWIADPDAQHPIGPEQPDDIFAIFPTGGTTGAPKGIVVTHISIMTMAANLMTHFAYHEGARHLVVAPMTHAAGIMACFHFARGGCNISMTTTNPAAVVEALERYRITHLFLPPTLLYMLLAEPGVRERDFSALRHLSIAAAPTSPEKLKEAIEVFGPVLSEFYGQAEAPATVCLKAPWDYLRPDGSIDERRLFSVGRPGVWNMVAILDGDGNEVPRGTAGEICVRGSLVAPGYYKNPEATAERRLNGWHLTGDIGRMDGDGYITIVDRKSDMVITGGFNVFPNEIEHVINSQPAVQDCSVIGIPDAKWGEALMAFVELKAGQALDADALKAAVRAALGPVKTPKHVEFMAELPRSPAGKVMRSTLRGPYWKNHGRGVN